MFLIVAHHPKSIADTTMARPCTWRYIGVLWRKLVSSFAVRLLSVKTPTAIDVRLWRHRLKVKRVAAAAGSAKMIQLFAVWNRTYKEFVGQAVNIDVAPLATNNWIISPVPSSQSAQPQPATCIWLDVNLLLNTLRERRNCDVHNPTPVWPKGCAGAIFL